jgi:uncharacterized damage-inducible protein DinB
MSRAIVRSMQGNIKFAFLLLSKFIQVCPQDIWVMRFGRWPVAQQLYHALTGIDFFIRPPQAGAIENPFPEASDLDGVAERIPDKIQTAEFLALIKAETEKYIDSLSDDCLAQKAPGASLRMGREVTHANVLVLLSAHSLYHLGSCDAALRQHGLAGVF